jgi:hypothetical protein
MHKFIILNTEEDYLNKEAEICSLLSIPDGKGTVSYSSERKIDNENHQNFGAYLFPVITEGEWKCDQHFDAAELVDFDSTWFSTEELV